MNIKTALLVNMRENGPELFTLREDFIFNCIASQLTEKLITTKVVCGNYQFLSKKKFDDSFKPELIMFSLDFLDEDVIKLIQHFKNLFYNVIIGAGGNFATRHHNELLNNFKEFDFIIRGEGDYTLYNTIEAYNNNTLYEVKGLSFREQSKIFINDSSTESVDIETLPFSDRQVLEDNNLSIAYIASSRGCTRNCSFCCNHVYWYPELNNKWRGRSAKNTVDEIEYVYNQYNIRIFNFVDSSFEDPGISNERMREIAQEILSRNINIGFFVNFRVTTVRNNDFDETIDLLQKAGLLGVFFGVETANQNDKKLYQKVLDSNLSVYANNYFKKKGLSSSCGFINFNPYSNIEDLKLNNELLREMQLGSYFLFRSKLRIYKGTPLYTKIDKDNLLIADKYYNYRFRFQNPEVEIISNQLEAFLTDNENKWFVDKTRYYCKYYSQNLKMLLFFFPNLRDEINEQEFVLSKFIEERNKIHCDMFAALLTAAQQNDFNAEKAKQIIQDIKIEDAIKKLVYIEKKKLMLYKQLASSKSIKQIYKTLY